MNSQELPPLTNRSTTLSGSSACNTSHKPGRHSESLLDLTSRSPHSFSSSSANSHLSGNQSSGRLPRISSWSIIDQQSNNTSKLGTLFEQKQNPDVNSLEGCKTIRSRSHSQDGRTQPNMVRGKLKGILTNSNSISITNSPTIFRKPPLKRINSESKLLVSRKNAINSTINSKRLSVDKIDVSTKSKSRNGYSTGKRTNLDINGNANSTLTSSSRKISLSTDRIDHVAFQLGDKFDDDSNSDEDIHDRVLLWLEEVDREAETPPEPNFVFEDVPSQTDSAIHIVYEES